LKLNESEAKEWIWEAISKIGNEYSYERVNIEIELVGGNATLPRNLEKIKTISISDGRKMVETRDTLGAESMNVPTYFINNKVIQTNLTNETLSIEAMRIPTDSEGNPLIVDNVRVIEAVSSYVVERLGRRAYFSGAMSESMYRRLEADWLFNVQSANSALMMPSEDGMREFADIHNGMSTWKDDLTPLSSSTKVFKYVDKL